MALVEPLVSELHMADGVWAAVIIDLDGTQVTSDDIDARLWARDMAIAARVLDHLDPGPRQLVIVHPEGYGRPGP